MKRRMGIYCLNCDTYTSHYENIGAWLRFRALCNDCVDKGYSLELYTHEAFASQDRKWFVGVKHGGRWVKGRGEK